MDAVQTRRHGDRRAVQPLVLNEPNGPGQPRHIAELDGLRGVAVLIVIFYHIAFALMPYERGWMHLFMDLCSLGYLGVDVFFVLSGFLITRILLRSRDAARYGRNFYARRVLRLAPAYLLTIALVAVFAPGNGASLLLSLVYLANFATLFHFSAGYGILWSLSVEEHFYLLWPWLVRFAALRRLPVVCLVVCILSPAVRVYQALHGGFDPYLSWYRFDGLAWGALLALLLVRSGGGDGGFWRKVGWVGLAFFASGLYAWVALSKLLGASIFFTAVPMMTAALIAFALERRRGILAPLRSRVLRFFGDISYWLYLIHALLIFKIMQMLQARSPALLAHGGFGLWLGMALAVIGLGAGSGVPVRRWLELPALRLKARFPSSGAEPGR